MARYGEEVAALARPLDDPGDLDVLLDRVGDAKVVMLGEASHGTHEFYAWRAALTRRLIEEHGFSFVAVEGDWPDCDRVDRSVRAEPGAPTIRARRCSRSSAGRPGCGPTRRSSTSAAGCAGTTRRGRRRPGGLPRPGRLLALGVAPRDHRLPARARPRPGAGRAGRVPVLRAVRRGPAGVRLGDPVRPRRCEDEVVGPAGRGCASRRRDFGVWQNAEVVAGAEHYYRAMVHGGPKSWNVRDRHMDETLDRLLDALRPAESKAVVWAHNTHVGDARGTDQSRARRGDHRRAGPRPVRRRRTWCWSASAATAAR